MSEHQHATQTRIEAATAVRRLINAMVGHQGGEQDLVAVADMANGLAKRFEQAEPRIRQNDMMMRYTEPVPEGGELSCWPDCMVAGSAHPHGTGLTGRREGDEVVASVVLSSAYEGPPGRVHGGMIASLFDEVFGFALWMDAVPAYTAWLTVNYRKPLLLNEDTEFRGTITRRENRKVFLSGSASQDGQTMVDAEGLFVIPREFASVLASEDG